MHDLRVMDIRDINLEFQDMDFSPQGEKDVREIMQSINRGDTIPPILVSDSGYLQDGRHRLAAYKRLGFKTIEVEIGRHPDAHVSVVKVRNFVPVDDFGTPLKQTTRMIMFSNIPIPPGSFIAYIVTDGGSVHTVFANKTQARKDHRSSRKYYDNPDDEIALMEVYVTKYGEFIDGVSI
jgi:5-formaminoimidazole-4-carboxamide-1-beta-D-ribofuranosyl 5'-monophosphate synthetase